MKLSMKLRSDENMNLGGLVPLKTLSLTVMRLTVVGSWKQRKLSILDALAFKVIMSFLLTLVVADVIALLQ
jgi:hypothetical protein